MTKWPVFNNGTIATASMIAADEYFNTTLWYGSNPYLEHEGL